jgi:hypothetical protein
MPPVGVDLYAAYLWYTVHVWDPITDEQWEVPLPYLYPSDFFYGVVLCAAAVTCNHLDCHGKAFVIVLVYCADFNNMLIYAYSSETAAWSEAATLPIHLDAPLIELHAPTSSTQKLKLMGKRL